MDPYILGRTEDSVLVHFLYVLSHRRALIERKVQRHDAGSPVASCNHARREGLSKGEIEAPLEGIRATFRA
jgi:hypothetical protein